ncbi:MAG: hypothetical protein GY816_23970 [Cytophagales bacterium]|nr:hypothetical protein [Cytophagales bacterium]
MEVTKLMVPVARRYRAATQVNVVSPEIADIKEADNIVRLEGSIQMSVIGKAICAPSGSQTVARYRKERVGTWESLYAPLEAHNGIVRINNPSRWRWYALPQSMLKKTRGHG